MGGNWAALPHASWAMPMGRLREAGQRICFMYAAEPAYIPYT